MKRIFIVLLSAFFIGALCLVSSCGSCGIKPPPSEEVEVSVYYLKNTDISMYLVREVHTVKMTTNIYEAALEQLIRGVPQTADAFSVIPPQTKVLGVQVTNKVATINFSPEVLNANVGAMGESLGILSLVNTLTEFQEIEMVSFVVDGILDERTLSWWGHVTLMDQPFFRDLSDVWEPAIWLYEPRPGQKIEGPLNVRGSARVFEGTVNLRLLAEDGNILEETFTTAIDGVPGPGSFTATIENTPLAGSSGVLEVFWYSPQDGTELDKISIPLQF